MDTLKSIRTWTSFREAQLHTSNLEVVHLVLRPTANLALIAGDASEGQQEQVGHIGIIHQQVVDFSTRLDARDSIEADDQALCLSVFD